MNPFAFIQINLGSWTIEWFQNDFKIEICCYLINLLIIWFLGVLALNDASVINRANQQRENETQNYFEISKLNAINGIIFCSKYEYVW